MSQLQRWNRPLGRRRSTALGLLTAAGLFAPGLAGETFEDRSEVIEVQVPVTVVDKDGQSLRGLVAEDFEVFDDGKAREITGFRAVDLEELAAEDGRGRPLLAAMPSAVRRHFLLLFDLSFSSNTAIVRAREAARRFVLDQLHPTDLAAVATLSKEHGPQLLVTFTPDRAQLARGIDVVGRQQVNANADPLRFLIADLPAASNRLDASTIDRQATGEGGTLGFSELAVEQNRIMSQRFEQTERHLERREITAWSRTLADLAKNLGAVAGRKQVLYFSEGFDGRLMLGRQPTGEGDETTDNLNILQGQNWQVDTDEIYGNTGLQGDVNEMLREFQRADCVIQAIDIGGLRAGADVRRTIGNRGQESLFVMADGTGGDLFDNANDLNGQLGVMLRRQQVTYLLSFQPEDIALDGSYRRLKVKLRDKKGRVSFRAGYYAPRPYPELDPLEKTLLAGEAIASAVPKEDLAVDVLAVPFPASDEHAYVPVILEVDGEALLAGGKRERLNLEIFAYVTDGVGEIKDFFTESLVVDASANKQAFRKGGLKYYGHLELDRGADYLLRVLVRDADSGRTGVETAELFVPGVGERTTHLLPPLFLDPPGRWVLFKETPQQGRPESVVYPFIVNGQPFIPAARPALGPRQSADLCLVVYHLDGGTPEVTSRILDEEGQEIEGGRLALTERTVTGIESLDKILATFSPRGLDGGRYTLEVALGPSGSEARPFAAIPFEVRN
jgi:VWFA-related protein